MEEEKIPSKIPWWIIPLVIALSFPGGASAWLLKGWDLGIHNIGKFGYVHYFNAASVVVFFLLTLITMKATQKFKLSPATSAYIYAAVAIGTFQGCITFPYHTFARLLGARYIDAYKLAAKYMPSWWMISKDAVKAFQEPGPISPEWGPVILYWWTFGVCLWFLIMGFSIFLRRQWYDVDNLTYPYAQVALESIRTARDPSRPQTKKLLIGALIGILVFFPYIMRMYFTWFPDVWGWHNAGTHDDYLALRLDLVWPTVFKSAVGLTEMTYNPLYVAMGFFIPLSTLFSAAFFYVVYVLIGTQIAWYLGYYTGIENVSAGTRADLLRHSPPINETAFVEWGIVPSIFVMAIVLNFRGSILRPLRVALGMGSETEKQEEKKEPISYRTALIMIIVSAAIIYSLLTVSGFPLDDALLYLMVSIILYQLSYGRARGYAGPIPVGDRIAPLIFRWKYPNVTISNVPGGYLLYGMSGHFVTDSNASFGGTTFPIFESWRVGIDLGVDLKSLFKVMSIAGLIAPLSAMLGFVVIGQSMGISHSANPSISDGTSRGIPSYVYSRPSIGAWPWIVSGVLLTFFLSFMRFRFVWWPLDPVGAFIGLGGPGLKIGIGWAFIIALILKYMVLKVGGSKLYTDTVAPFVTGYIVGTAIMCIVGMIIGSIIFIKPF